MGAKSGGPVFNDFGDSDIAYGAPHGEVVVSCDISSKASNVHELSFNEFLSAAVSQTSMKRYKFVRNCNFDSSFAMSNKCASMSCPVDLLQEHWPDAPPRVREQYRVLLKVGSVNRTKVENMLNQIRLPIRPFQADCISQLAIRLLRATEGLGPVSADFPLYGLAPPAHVSGDSDCKQQ